jgi:hypothetical protein
MAAIGLFDMLERLNPSGAAMNSPVDAALLATVPDGKDVPAEGSGKASSTTIPQADLMADTAIARVTGGISPAAVGNAYCYRATMRARRSPIRPGTSALPIRHGSAGLTIGLLLPSRKPNNGGVKLPMVCAACRDTMPTW